MGSLLPPDLLRCVRGFIPSPPLGAVVYEIAIGLDVPCAHRSVPKWEFGNEKNGLRVRSEAIGGKRGENVGMWTPVDVVDLMDGEIGGTGICGAEVCWFIAVVEQLFHADR